MGSSAMTSSRVVDHRAGDGRALHARRPTAGRVAARPGRSARRAPGAGRRSGRMRPRGVPVTSSANATFSRTVLRGSSRKSWNTMPICRRRRGTSRALDGVEVEAGDRDRRRWSASSSRTSSLMSVLLPAPDGPTRNTKSPSGTIEVDVLEGVLAVGVDLASRREARSRSAEAMRPTWCRALR